MGSQMSQINLRMSGTNPGGEEWTTGVWLGTLNPVVFSEGGLINYASLVQPICTTFWTGLKPRVATGTAWTSISLYGYNVGSDSAAAVYHLDITPNPGSANASAHPAQVAVVASLRSASPTRQGRGRMYLPLTGLDVLATTLQTQASSAQAIAAQVQLFLNSLAGTEYDEQAIFHPVVYSRSQSSSRDVVSIVVNTVADIQRRRASQQVPVSTTTLPVA